MSDSGARLLESSARRRRSLALDQSRKRIDDLNVYPVPGRRHGDEPDADRAGRRWRHSRRRSTADRATLAHETTRATLMGARGNSGVILSQLVRGAAGALAGPGRRRPPSPRPLRAARTRLPRRPPRSEGTILTVARELAGRPRPAETSRWARSFRRSSRHGDVVRRTDAGAPSRPAGRPASWTPGRGRPGRGGCAGSRRPFSG